jgi:2,5-dihydroxypyridine 5,6-dioxygenase
MSTQAASGYLDLGGSGALAIVDLMPGALALMDYAQVAAGESVLVLTERGVDPLALQAIVAAAAARDALVHVLAVPPFSPGGADRTVPSSLVRAAVAASDVVIGCTWWAEVHTAPLFFTEIPALGVRFASLHMTATAGALATGARFPLGLLYAIKRRVLERCLTASEMRVRTRHGTDVAFRGMRFDTDVGPLEPGMWRPFPVGGVNFYPEDTEGVLVVEESTVTGVPDGPLRVVLRENVVTDIVGGVDAARLRRFGPAGYYLRHAFIGLNPRVRLRGGTQFEREKHAGAFYLGIDGLGADGRPDRSGPGHAHCDCQFDRPTIDLDGEPLVVDGHLLVLDEPAIHEAAAAFGDPATLLDDEPVVPLPGP